MEMRTQVVAWEGFFAKQQPKRMSAAVLELNKIVEGLRRELTRKENLAKIATTTIALFCLGTDFSIIHAATGIDVAAEKIYKKLLNVGKWVIIVKGGIDTIQSTIAGDLQAAKKNFLGYLFVYVILWALPWGLKQVDVMFADMEG